MALGDSGQSLSDSPAAILREFAGGSSYIGRYIHGTVAVGDVRGWFGRRDGPRRNHLNPSLCPHHKMDSPWWGLCSRGSRRTTAGSQNGSGPLSTAMRVQLTSGLPESGTGHPTGDGPVNQDRSDFQRPPCKGPRRRTANEVLGRNSVSVLGHLLDQLWHFHSVVHL